MPAMHKVTKSEVIPWDEEKGTWGVRFEFDDGMEDYVYSETRKQADWDAHDRVGEEMPIGMNPALRSFDRLKAYGKRQKQEQK
jgi:hypothetical protein